MGELAERYKKVAKQFTARVEAVPDSGHYAPRVDVPDEADEQARLLAFTGRRP